MDLVTIILLIVAGILGTVIFFIFFQYRPRLILGTFLFYVIFQWLVVNRAGGDLTSLGRILTFIDEIFIVGIFFIILLDTFLRRRKVYLVSISFGLAIVVGTGIIGGLIGGTPPVIIASDILIFLKGFMVFYIFSYFEYFEAKLKKGVVVFTVVGIIILLVGGVELYKPAEIRMLLGNVTSIDWRMGIPSVQSVFIHPGLFGWFCGFSALFAFAFYLVRRKGTDMFFFIIFTLGVLISMRLKAVVGLALSAVFGLWLYSSRAKVKLVCMIGMVAVLVTILFGSKISGMVGEQIREYQNPLKPRNVLYRTGFKVAEEYFPFGAGFGRFGGEIAARYYSPVYRRYKFELMYGLWPGGRFLRDTFWPMILGELGVIGFLAYVAVLILLFRLMVNSYHRADSVFLKSFTLGVCLVFIEGVIESLAEPVFTKPPACYLLFAVMGISYASYLRYYKAR